MELVGRTNEIAIMQKLLLSKKSEFLAMYGRRRIGKTFLIREVYKANTVFDCSGVNDDQMQMQLDKFYASLCNYYPASKLFEQPKTWLQAFLYLEKYIQSKKSKTKKVIFLDEVSWFDTHKSGFLAALNIFWNDFCTKRNDVVLVICGSAASWIIDKVINNKGGLHNRITRQIQLLPFNLAETKLYLQSLQVKLTNKDIVQLYMATGGVPFYLDAIEPGESVQQILEHLFFSKNALLKNEFQNLYASLFKNHEQHEKIVKTLAGKQNGFTRNELLVKTKLSSGGAFTKLLTELVQCGFVMEVLPYGKSKDDTLYRLCDEYTYFYYKFINTKNANASWQECTNQTSYTTWCGYAFENICLKHIAQIKEALKIAGIVSHAASWVAKGSGAEKGAQIDLLIDRADNCINICEAKFYNEPLTITKVMAQNLQNKLSIFKQKNKVTKNIFVTMITTYGVIKNENALSVVTNYIELDALFKNL